MSVIIKDENGRIILYSKGADSVIEERMKLPKSQFFNKTWDHLKEYATMGLRTLVMAKREISLEEYNKWNEKYKVFL